MPAAPTTPSGDAIQATINVSVAQSRRLVSSWLPPPTQEEIASRKTDKQLAKEDAELFTPMPPRLGLGAPIPKDFLESTNPKARRQAISTNEHLKRKIIGRTKPSPNHEEASKPRPRAGSNQQNPSEDEDDEEKGRSSLGKPKRRKVIVEKKERIEEGMADEDGGDGEGDAKATKAQSPSPTEEATKPSHKGPIRFGTYLDVHKAEKAKKKRKKRKKPAN